VELDEIARALAPRLIGYALARTGCLGTAVVLIVLSVWQVRKRAGEHALPTSLAITGEGSMLVVESQDGRRWIVGPAPEPRIGGGYVIVVPQ
jgi:hypothetical protein